jgi:hypothetical protein
MSLNIHQIEKCLKYQYSYGMNHINVLLHEYFPCPQTKQVGVMVSLWPCIWKLSYLNLDWAFFNKIASYLRLF